MRHAAAHMGTHSLFGASKLALYIGMLFAKPNHRRRVTAALRVRAGKPLAAVKKKRQRMNAQDVIRLGRIGLVLAAASAFSFRPASAQQAIKFSLDFKFEGPAAPFVVAIDKGYFKAEGLT